MISRAELGKVLSVYADRIKQGDKPQIPASIQAGSDRVSLSPRAQDVSKVRALIKEGAMPPERQERVEALKAKVQKGEYKVSGRDVAEKIIQRHMIDRLQ